MTGKNKTSGPKRVVITGGPAAGKTAVLELVRRHLADEVAVVPEAATILFSGGFPRRSGAKSQRVIQQAIFQVQRATERMFEVSHAGKPHVTDRGSIDGAAYWPDTPDAFFAAMRTTLEAEFRRYDAVIFLQSTAYDAKSWPDDNPHRIETPAEACRLDRKLKRIWGRHPHFHFVPHATNFYEKVALCLIALNRILGVGRETVPANHHRLKGSAKK